MLLPATPRMSHDFDAELRVTAAFRQNAPRTPLRLALTFLEYPGVETRAEVTPVRGGPAGGVRVLILAQRFFAGRLRPEMVFEGRRDGEAVARGIITAVANAALRLPPGTHPDSVNLHRYPADVAAYLDRHYGARAALVRQRLQVLLGERPDCRLPRIIRAILYLGGGDAEALDEACELARADYRDLLLAAEYVRGADGALRRVRDFREPLPAQDP